MWVLSLSAAEGANCLEKSLAKSDCSQDMMSFNKFFWQTYSQDISSSSVPSTRMLIDSSVSKHLYLALSSLKLVLKTHFLRFSSAESIIQPTQTCILLNVGHRVSFLVGCWLNCLSSDSKERIRRHRQKGERCLTRECFIAFLEWTSGFWKFTEHVYHLHLLILSLKRL